MQFFIPKTIDQKFKLSWRNNKIYSFQVLTMNKCQPSIIRFLSKELSSYNAGFLAKIWKHDKIQIFRNMKGHGKGLNK